MKVEFLEIKGCWRDVADAARTTVSKEAGDKQPSSEWKKKILLAEHSPIRQLVVKWKWVDLPYWVSTHFVRHKVGIEHWVSTQREDRTGVSRDSLRQTDLVWHECEANAQALINISRKRLCLLASKETRMAWQLMLEALRAVEPELYKCCVRDCIYRTHCFEMKSCGYSETYEYEKELNKYLKFAYGGNDEKESKKD